MIQQFPLHRCRYPCLGRRNRGLHRKGREHRGRPPPDQLRAFFDEFALIRPKLVAQFAEVHDDLQKMQAAAPTRLKLIAEPERPQLETDQLRLSETLATIGGSLQCGRRRPGLATGAPQAGQPGQDRRRTCGQAAAFSKLTQELSLVQARARLETITIEPIQMSPEEALEIARAARQDWMNNRATVVDTWRLIPTTPMRSSRT